MADGRRTHIRAIARKTAASVLRQYEKWIGKTFESVLILGHMRSGSTLLHHILISHQDLLGSGERNAYYGSLDDLAMLRLRVQHDQRLWLRFPKYAVDQVNHNKFTPSPILLRAPQVRCIFLLREPITSVSSLMRVLAPLYGFGLEEAVAYYNDRLAGLARLAASLADSKQTAFLTYDDLLHKTRATLSGLSSFLELDADLDEEYNTFNFTGRRGDPGKKIQRKRISRESSEPLNLPSAEVEKLEAAYTECMRVMSEMHPRLCLAECEEKGRSPSTILQ